MLLLLKGFRGGFLMCDEATRPSDSTTTFNLVMLMVRFVEIYGVDVGQFFSSCTKLLFS